MKPYLIALAVGVLVGVIYGLLNVRSPAPPVVALVGLLGILLGEQVVPLAKRLTGGGEVSLAALRQDCARHVFGRLPGHPDTSAGGRTATPPAAAEPPSRASA